MVIKREIKQEGEGRDRHGGEGKEGSREFAGLRGNAVTY